MSTIEDCGNLARTHRVFEIRERKIVARYITLRPFLQFSRSQIVSYFALAQFMPFMRVIYVPFIKVGRGESTQFG